MITQQLLNYINQRLIYGASREEIKKDLLDAGWQEDDIDAAIAQATSFPEAAPSIKTGGGLKKGLLALVLIGILIASGGVFGYFHYFKNKTGFLFSPTPSITPTAFLSPTPTLTLTATPSATASPRPTPTPRRTRTIPTPSPTPTATPKAITPSGIYTIEDDGTLITSNVPSDRGIVNDLVNETGVINKFFKEYPTAPDVYDFVIVFTSFKPPNAGHFTHEKELDLGISDFDPVYDLGHTRQLSGFSGQGRFKGFAFIPDMYNTIGDDFWIVIHELSHRWLFYLKDSGTIDGNLAHYKDNISTLTEEGSIIYKDPNGSGSLIPNPSAPGYCLDFGFSGRYRFTNLSLYLMGLIPPDQTILLKQYETSGGWSDKGISCVEKTFSVQDIINLAGARKPSYSTSQKDFSVAYILLTHKGEKPTDANMQKMNNIADNFPIKWNETTNYKSTINKRGVIR